MSKILSSSLSLSLAYGAVVLAGCYDPCSSDPDTAAVTLGTLPDGATFEPLADGAELTLGFAPQGGMGLPTAVQTVGLEVHRDFLFARQVGMHVRLIGTTPDGDPDVLGDFPFPAPTFCNDGVGGVAADVIFGLDTERFGFGDPDNAALADLNGQTVTLELEATDVNGVSASTSGTAVVRVQN